MGKLNKIEQLIEKLNASGIRFCHWKSNLALAKALAGQTDIDLLIDRKCASSFRTVLSQLCFRPAVQKEVGSFPSVEHYFALDEETGVLVHVHAYFRVITGESLAKNYRFPIEEMLLQNTREVDSVPVPTRSAELVVFTLRMMLKHTSFMELVLLARYWKEVQQEIMWLLETGTIEETLGFIDSWLPSLDTNLFSDCITALKSPAPLFQRVLLGLRLRRQLRPYARHSAIRAWLDTVQKFSTMLFRRLTRSHKGMISRGGGAVIAFVGSEATGKSTLISEMRGWLGEHFAVKQIHVGKPKSTAFTTVPNLFLPALRSLFPGSRSTHIANLYDPQEQSEKPQTGYSLLFAFRSALLAYDRWSLLSRAFSQAANGTIMLCDRYPSLGSGALDSPQLSHFPVPPNRYSVRRWLTQFEARLYREMPTPDLIIYLSAPLEVVVLRNAARGKKEPEDYVRWRYARSANLEFGKTPVCKINTDQPLDRTVLEVKKAIWNVL